MTFTPMMQPALQNNPHVAGMIAGAQAYFEQAGAPDPERQALMRYAALLDREALVMMFNDQSCGWR